MFCGLSSNFAKLRGNCIVTTAVFSTCGMGIFTFSLAAILSLPKQFITVYLGVILEESSTGNYFLIVFMTFSKILFVYSRKEGYEIRHHL